MKKRKEGMKKEMSKKIVPDIHNIGKQEGKKKRKLQGKKNERSKERKNE